MAIGKYARDEEERDQQAFLPKEARDEEDILLSSAEASRKAAWRYLRLAVEIAMAFVIAILLFRLSSSSNDNGEPKHKPSPVPRFPLKTYTFLEDPKYLHDDMFSSREETLHTLHRWIELSAKGRGYVKINDSQSFDLSEPYTVNEHGRDEPVYMMSVFHQLHCLSYLVETFRTALDPVEEVSQEVVHHTVHCFDYLRQSIMCAADTSLEGKTEAGPGWGSTHECADYDALLEWANERSVVLWRGVLPDEAVL